MFGKVATTVPDAKSPKPTDRVDRRSRGKEAEPLRVAAGMQAWRLAGYVASVAGRDGPYRWHPDGIGTDFNQCYRALGPRRHAPSASPALVRIRRGGNLAS